MSHLPGYAKEHHDDQGVSAPLLSGEGELEGMVLKEGREEVKESYIRREVGFIVKLIKIGKIRGRGIGQERGD